MKSYSMSSVFLASLTHCEVHCSCCLDQVPNRMVQHNLSSAGHWVISSLGLFP